MSAATVPVRALILRLSPWHRLSVRVAALCVAVALFSVGLVSFSLFERVNSELEDELGADASRIAQIGTLLIDSGLVAAMEGPGATPQAYDRLRQALDSIQERSGLDSPIYVLLRHDVAGAPWIIVKGGARALRGEPFVPPAAPAAALARAVLDGAAVHTNAYERGNEKWISAFAPLQLSGHGALAALGVDLRVKPLIHPQKALLEHSLGESLLGALTALIVGLWFARGITAPVGTLTQGAAKVLSGDFSQSLPVKSRDELGELTRTFNKMLEGLRQRDFVRSILGRYVSPEVARTLLESPDGLRFGGKKREVSILMSDLRGYTQFAAQGEPEEVMSVLNDYLARMNDVVIAYGGVVNEYIGDAVFAVFGAPLFHADHAERATAAAIEMQRQMQDLNRLYTRRGQRRFDIGIGVNTGEAVVGNIGNERRAKYAVVGNAVNLAARVEACTVGGQILISESTCKRLRDLVEVGSPVAVDVKGYAEPLLIYELRAIRGRFAQRLTEEQSAPQIHVTLPLTCWVIKQKRVSEQGVEGIVLRLGSRQLDVHLEAPLPPLTDVRLRLSYPELGHDSGDLYGKVTGHDDEAGGVLTRIALTSVEGPDRAILEGMLQT